MNHQYLLKGVTAVGGEGAEHLDERFADRRNGNPAIGGGVIGACGGRGDEPGDGEEEEEAAELHRGGDGGVNGRLLMRAGKWAARLRIGEWYKTGLES